MNVAVVGVGLIGGSLALDLKAAGLARRVVGVDLNPRHAAQALRLGTGGRDDGSCRGSPCGTDCRSGDPGRSDCRLSFPASWI